MFCPVRRINAKHFDNGATLERNHKLGEKAKLPFGAFKEIHESTWYGAKKINFFSILRIFNN